MIIKLDTHQLEFMIRDCLIQSIIYLFGVGELNCRKQKSDHILH